VGKGTGLGLSICYGIVKEHGGDVIARNHAEGGAVLEIRIPVAARAGAAIATPEPIPVRESALEGRVLLAEDEEAVLDFERDVLVGAGIEVSTLKSTRDFKERVLTEPYDGVIVSGTSASWSVPDLYRWLQEKSAESAKHVLFTFSAAPDAETREFLQENKVAFLVKPFEVADLIVATRNILVRKHAAVAGD
jgi:two-component system, NtrC family, sensor kinase